MIDRLFLAGEESGDTQPDSTRPQFGKADGIRSPPWVSHLEIGFQTTDFRDVHTQIAVPIHSVECNVEVGIENQHGRILRREGNEFITSGIGM
jgi:hypothetical protein